MDRTERAVYISTAGIILTLVMCTSAITATLNDVETAIGSSGTDLSSLESAIGQVGESVDRVNKTLGQTLDVDVVGTVDVRGTVDVGNWYDFR